MLKQVVHTVTTEHYGLIYANYKIIDRFYANGTDDRMI